MSGALRAACEAVAAEVTAPGSDPALITDLVAWAVRPRRTLEALRRIAAEDGVDTDPPAWLRAQVRDSLHRDDLRAAAAVLARWRSAGCHLAVVGDPAYPARLAQGWPTTDGPVLLASVGVLPADRPAVAIVGARRATSYGTGVAAWLAEAASLAGVHVVSGGALGIDAAAHRAALAGPGGSSVVLGCGHQVRYPRDHARDGGLFDELVDAGGAVLSEQLPDVAPRAGIVRARNRVVAGLADVVVVVEGGGRSGALLTASAASDRARTVLAVPGDVRAPGSVAPHRLLAEGAAMCTGPEDLLRELPGQVRAGPARSGDGSTDRGVRGTVRGAHPRAPTLPLTVLPETVRSALEASWPRALRTDEVLAAADLAPGSVLAALTRGQVAGEVVEGPEGFVLARAPGG